MFRLVGAALTSLLLYAALFGAVLDRPLTVDDLAHQLDARLARAATIHRPKLVILAGSNGPYSHRCELIEAMIDRPCVNGGVAVGIGLDYLFARWRPKLHPGDVVYLPMEQAQYVRSRLTGALGPDAAFMFRHDWATLRTLGPLRWVAALFAFDPRAALMSGIEMALVAGGFHDPRAAHEGTVNPWGDHVGHTAALGTASQAVLGAMAAPPEPAASIRAGYGTAVIIGFLRWARAHGVHVIGGLPTELDTQPLPATTRAAIAAVYIDRGADFLTLPNLSRYPPSAFFDTPLHLNEEAQIAHSDLLARALGRLLDRGVRTTALSPGRRW